MHLHQDLSPDVARVLDDQGLALALSQEEPVELDDWLVLDGGLGGFKDGDCGQGSLSLDVKHQAAVLHNALVEPLCVYLGRENG